MTLSKKEFLIFASILAIFLSLHLFGLRLPYHQDEYKWPMLTNPTSEAGTVVHPPLAEFTYREIGPIVGLDNFRIIPFAFGLLNLFLIFYLAKIVFDPFDKLGTSKTALWTAFLFTFSFYSLLASLMVDTDGAVMPAFFLIMAIGYFQLRKTNFQFSIFNFQNWIWLILLIVGAAGGFLVKMSGILPLVAFALDFAIIKKFFADKKRFLRFLGLGVLLAGLVVLVLLLAKLIFPFFPLEKSIKYWEHFANSSSFFDRGWLQTFIQFAKSILYTSPLLLLPVFFVDKEIWEKTRPFFIFIFIGLVFYLFAFDFSLGALDRYLQFLIIPLCIISGAVFAKTMNYESRIKDYALPLFISILIFSVQFFNHLVPPLHPKTEWIARAISMKWNFLFPFSGGSGPLPFYVSFLFMALVWVCSIVFVLSLLKMKNIKKQILFCVLILGILYNGVFIEEYLFGKINGSAPGLVLGAIEFIKNDQGIKKVTVYNDNGGYEVQKTGKYRKRLYIDPKFDVNEKIQTLNRYKEHYLVVDIPKIDPDSVYQRYFDSCNAVYKEKDKYISATIYNCQNAPDLKF